MGGAARAGTDTDFHFGGKNSDFFAYENFADYQMKKFAVFGVDPQPLVNPLPTFDFVPSDKRFNDGAMISTAGGRYAPNPFALYDMLGNVCEWTSSAYTETLGGKPVEDRAVVRGGSWRDRPKWARVSMRKAYRPWQGVYNVGFRIVIEDAAEAAKVFKAAAPLPEKPPHSLGIKPDTIPFADASKK